MMGIVPEGGQTVNAGGRAMDGGAGSDDCTVLKFFSETIIECTWCAGLQAGAFPGLQVGTSHGWHVGTFHGSHVGTFHGLQVEPVGGGEIAARRVWAERAQLVPNREADGAHSYYTIES